jgi:uncharacterized membrane protein (DUF2068 family)
MTHYTSSFTYFQLSKGEYVRALPNATSIVARMTAMSALMMVIAGVWLLSAIGLWKRHRWGWWLALIQNGLAAIFTLLLQIFYLRSYLLDNVAVLAVIVLLLPSVRRDHFGAWPGAQCTSTK